VTTAHQGASAFAGCILKDTSKSSDSSKDQARVTVTSVLDAGDNTERPVNIRRRYHRHYA